jgi:hypothetical protein
MGELRMEGINLPYGERWSNNDIIEMYLDLDG